MRLFEIDFVSRRRNMLRASPPVLIVVLACASFVCGQERQRYPYKGDLSIQPPPIAMDNAVKYDYDIVYVRAPRRENGKSRWAEVGDPRIMEPGSDLMLLHPDGK